MTTTYKGKEYGVQTGAKGGQFFIDDSGKKHYLKNSNPSPKTKKKEALKKKAIENSTKPNRYICYYEKRIDGELVDDFKEWCDAYSYEEAKSEFESRYYDDRSIIISLITR